MPENDTAPQHLCLQPTEVLLYIFTFLSAKQLTKCREVCLRWKAIIDNLSRSENMWYKYCKQDFKSIHVTARQKSWPDLTWYSIYRSLSLWPKLLSAREIRDEFASASNMYEEIQGLTILRDGLIGVHKKAGIIYYDLSTLELSKREPISGNYLRYTENLTMIVILSLQLQMYVICEHIDTCIEQSVTFDDVKLFLLRDQELFFVNLANEIYVCLSTESGIREKYIGKLDEGVMSLGYANNTLSILTLQRNIYTVNGTNIALVCALGSNNNLLHELRKYNLLEQLDWRIYFQWMFVLNHTIPEGPLRDIVSVKSYGDIFFIGSNWGVLRIYYAPYRGGEFDVFKSEPLKQFNFMERYDCPVLSMCPILQVDIAENEDGHTVFVVMPKKIAVLTFLHSFKRTASVAMLPYSDVQKMKILKIDECV